jgi:Tol biopolymer transport system component
MHSELRSMQDELAPRYRLMRWVAAFGSAAVLAVIAVIVWVARFRPLPLQADVQVRYRQITTNSPENPVASGAISPDGKYLVYSDLKGLHVKVLETGEARSIPQPAELDPKSVTWEIIWRWLADGTRFVANAHRDELAWTTSGTRSIWVGSVMGGGLKKIRDHAAAYSVSPDGKQIAFQGARRRNGESEIWLMDSDGQRPHKFLEAPGNAILNGFEWPADGRRIIYMQEDQPEERIMLSRDLKGGAAVAIFSPSEMRRLDKFDEPLWLHDGRYVSAIPEEDDPETCNYWARRIDWSTGKQLDSPRRLSNWSGMCAHSGSVTADGKRLAFLGIKGKNTVYLGGCRREIS